MNQTDPDLRYKTALIKDIAALITTPIHMLTTNDIFQPWVPGERVGRYCYCGSIKWRREILLKGEVTYDFFNLTLEDAMRCLELLREEDFQRQVSNRTAMLNRERSETAYHRKWLTDVSMGSLQYPGMIQRSNGSTLHYFVCDEYPGIWKVNETLPRNGRIQLRTFYQCRKTGLHFAALKRLLKEINALPANLGG